MTATIPKGFHPEPFSYHQELELDIDALSNAGDGIGRVDGWVVFVPFALPGDRVKARVWRNDRNYSSADLVEVINPSPDRVEPGCRLFGTCGGCQYQHFSYDRQLLWKTRQVADLLRLQAGLELPVNPAVASPRQYHYRSKITPHFDKPKEGGKPAIGFLKAGSRRDVVDVPQCPIAMEYINEALPLARKAFTRPQPGSSGEPPFCSGPRKEPSSPITMPSPANGWAIWNSIFWRETFSRIILSFFRFLRITWPNRRVWTGRNSWWTPTAVPACSP